MAFDSYYGELSTLEFIAYNLNTNEYERQYETFESYFWEFFKKSGISKYYFGLKYIENSEDSNNNNNNVKSWKDGEIVEIASKEISILIIIYILVVE